MGIDGTRVMAGLAGAIVTAALGVGIAAGQSDTTSGPQPIDIDPSCVLGITSVDMPPGAEPWALGLLARSDALNRQHGLGRHAPGGECADIPDWLRALALRSDGMNRLNGLGPYAVRAPMTPRGRCLRTCGRRPPTGSSGPARTRSPR